MKHFKPIIIAFIIFIMGFVVWQTMWINELRGKYDINHLSDNLNQKKELIIKDFRKTERGRENPVNSRVKLPPQLPQETAKPLAEEESGKSNEYFSPEDIEAEKRDRKVKTDIDKTKSVTQKNNTLYITIKNDDRPITLRNTAPQQPMKALKERVGSNTSHSTSTIRQW